MLLIEDSNRRRKDDRCNFIDRLISMLFSGEEGVPQRKSKDIRFEDILSSVVKDNFSNTKLADRRASNKKYISSCI